MSSNPVGGVFLKFYFRFLLIFFVFQSGISHGSDPTPPPACPNTLEELLQTPPPILGLGLIDKLALLPTQKSFFPPIDLNEEQTQTALKLKRQFIQLSEIFDALASDDLPFPNDLIEKTATWASDMVIFLGILGIPVIHKGTYLELVDKGGKGPIEKFVRLFNEEFPGKTIRLSPMDFGSMEGAPNQHFGEGSFFSTTTQSLVLSPDSLITKNRLFIFSVQDILPALIQIQLFDENLARRTFQKSTYIDFLNSNADRILSSDTREYPLYLDAAIKEILAITDPSHLKRSLSSLEVKYSRMNKRTTQAIETFDEALVAVGEMKSQLETNASENIRLGWDESKTTLIVDFEESESFGPLQLRLNAFAVPKSSRPNETHLSVVLSHEEFEVFIPFLDPNLNSILTYLLHHSSWEDIQDEIPAVILNSVLPAVTDVLSNSSRDWFKIQNLLTGLENSLDPSFRAFGRPKLEPAQALIRSFEI